MFNLTYEERSALAFCFLFCFFVYAAGQLIKKNLLYIFKSPIENAALNQADGSNQIHMAFQDGIAAFQVCACSLENAVVRATLGNVAVLASISIHGMLMLRFAWRDAYGSTCNAFSRYLKNQTDLFGVCLSWILQLLGAFLALHLSYFWWGLRLSNRHAYLHTQRASLLNIYENHKVGEIFESVGDLHVPLLAGVCVEAGVTFMDVLLSRGFPALLKAWKHRYPEKRLDEWWALEFVVFSIKQWVAIYLIYLCLPLTGAYSNGVNAIMHTWGLGRASNPLSHLVVYWLSPLLGFWIGFRVVEAFEHYTLAWTRHSPSSVVFVDLNEDNLVSDLTAVTSSADVMMPLMASAMVAGEGLPLAALCASPKVYRSRSLSRPSSERISLRYSSVRRFLPQTSRYSQLILRPSPRTSNDHPSSTDMGDSRLSDIQAETSWALRRRRR